MKVVQVLLEFLDVLTSLSKQRFALDDRYDTVWPHPFYDFMVSMQNKESEKM